MAEIDLTDDNDHHPVFREGIVHVMREQCSTCIFKPGNLMSLQPGRVAQMVRDAKAGDSVIPCHHTIHVRDERPAICRGYWDRHHTDVWTLRLANDMGIVQFDGEEQW